MRLTVKANNLIDVEGVRKEDVNFVMVDYVFFERRGESFYNTTDNNVDGFEVHAPTVDCVDMVLEITTAKEPRTICVFVEGGAGQRSVIQFIPAKRA